MHANRAVCLAVVLGWLVMALVAQTVLSGIGSAYAQAATSSTNISAVTWIDTWTRAHLAAVKERWAENEAKFAVCQRELEQQQKVRWLSVYRRAHLLEKCMKGKP